MENLIIALETVFPLFGYMAIGYIVKARKIINDETLKNMNGVLFKLFVPFMVFKTIYTVDMSQAFEPKIFAFTLFSVIIWGLGLMIIIPRVYKYKSDMRIGAVIQVLSRSNFIIFGIPIAESMYGASNVGTTAALVAITCPFFNSFGIFTLEYFKDKTANIKSIIIRSVKSPAIIAVTIGLLFLLFRIKLPDMCYEVVKNIGNATTPLALILLGGSLSFDDLKTNRRDLIVDSSIKLILLPVIFTIPAIWLGFRGQELLAMVTLFGGPVSIMAYITGVHLGSDKEYLGQMVTVTAAASVVTLFLWIFILKTLTLL